MRFVKAAIHAFMALVLAGGWGFLYWQSSAVDLAGIGEARRALDEVRAIDTRWNDQLVGGRPGGPAAAPSPGTAGAAARHQSAYARLEVRALKLGNPEAGRLMPELRTAFGAKADLVARFAQARLELAQAERADPPQPEKAQAARAVAEALFEQAWLASTGPRLVLVARAIDRADDDALAQADLYRVWLLYYSGFVLTVLAFALWSLGQSQREVARVNSMLREANETLEARVAERTRELSEALARLKESEAMLVHSEKMSSLGQMVAGIVHEVNTPLAYVKASMEGLARQVPELGVLATEARELLGLLSAEGADEARLAAKFARVGGLLDALEKRQTVQEVARQAEDGLFGITRISELVASLKNFSRLDRSQTALADLREGLESAVRIARHQLKSRQLVREFGDIPKVACAAGQVNQVFLNLITNAAQATPEQGGQITLRTRRLDDAHVAVEVADNGHGIPPEVLPRIFDPFFTTKPVGSGTGLGLSICYKIAQAHGGRLEVASTPGKGTCFTLILPVQPPAAGSAA
jgi:signal transduction histidine kinase